MNPGKCLVHTSSPRNRKTSFEVDGVEYQIVGNDVGFKILCTMVTLNGNSDKEFDNRLAAGWAKFHPLLPLLNEKDANIKQRLKLFDATVSKIVLWCCESWALTKKQTRRLRATRRAMLRRIFGPRRQPEEDYVHWIRAATRRVEELAENAGAGCWLKQYLHSKWLWAGKVACTSEDRIAYRTSMWRDSDWCSKQGTNRTIMRGRPGNRRRWEDDLRRYASSQNWDCWKAMAVTDVWPACSESFVEWASE
jgi:hypothetical protein